MNKATKEMLTAMFAVMTHEELRLTNELVWEARKPHMKREEEEEDRKKAAREAAAIEFANGLKVGDEVRVNWDSRRDSPPFYRGIVVKVNRVNVRLIDKWGEEVINWPKTAISSI